MNVGLRIFTMALAGGAGALYYSDRRWRRATEALMDRLKASSSASRGAASELAVQIEGLPAPVLRYFRRVLRDSPPVVQNATVIHQGQFRTGEGERWLPFSSTEVLSAVPPGFVWDASIRMGPGMSMRVRDSYVTGAASMHGALAGILPIIDSSGTAELDAGALMRRLAEAPWLPTSLLPTQGVRWESIDETTARATLKDGDTAVSLDFRFAPEGEILSAYSSARYREVKGTFRPTPWECRFSDYEGRHGMLIPLSGEVLWHLADRELPYWRGRIAEIVYEWASPYAGGVS